MIIRLILTNFSLVMIAVALGIAASVVAIKGRRGRPQICAEVFRWMSLLGAGVVGIYVFIIHVFFPNVSAENIGWKPSPFQFEVGIANLGFAVCCILAFWGNYSFRLASSIGITIWLWGDAVGHVHQMIVANNFSSGNAGAWFWSDLLVPTLLLLSLHGSREAEN